MIIKDFTIYQLRVLRVVCKFFASLIDGRFMNSVIYGIYRKGTWRIVRYYNDEILKKEERCWFRFKIKESEKKEKQPIGNVLQISTSDNRRKEFKEWSDRKNRRKSKFWKRNGNRRILDRVDFTVGCECEECNLEQPEKDGSIQYLNWWK